MRDDITIRPVRRGDGAGLASCWIEFGRDYAALDPVRFLVPSDEGLAEWFESTIAEDRDDALWVVAERDNDVIGFVRAQVLPPAPDADRQLMREMREPVLKVDSLFVRDEERGRGVGRSLMNAAEDWGRSRGATSAAVIAFAGSPSAVPFYEAGMGYDRNTIGFWKLL